MFRLQIMHQPPWADGGFVAAGFLPLHRAADRLVLGEL